MFLKQGGRVSFARLFWNMSSKITSNFPEIEKFRKVKKEIDPDNKFSNQMSNSILFDIND
jgi:hypothetical protein